MAGARIADGERITLRTVEQEDVPFLQRGTANAELRYSLGSRLMNQTQVEEKILDHNDDQFFVCLDETDAGSGQSRESETKPIGVIFVEDADWRRPELVYWLILTVHGDGYGKEALSLVIDYVFRVYAHPAIGAGVYEFNETSRNLLTSLGFSEEGRIRNDRFVDGDYVDTVLYGLLRTEWRDLHCDD